MTMPFSGTACHL